MGPLDSFEAKQELTALPGTLRLIKLAGQLTFVALVGLVLLGAATLSGALVRQRTHEIGLLKAVGYRDRAVLGLFLTEMAVVGVISGLAGLALGVATSTLLSRSLSSVTALKSYLPRVILWPSAQLTILMLTMVTSGMTVGALLLARRGARRELSVGLRDW